MPKKKSKIAKKKSSVSVKKKSPTKTKATTKKNKPNTGSITKKTPINKEIADSNSFLKSRFQTNEDYEEFLRLRDVIYEIDEANSSSSLRLSRTAIARLVNGSHDAPHSIEDILLFNIGCHIAQNKIPGYATLDDKHIDDIEKMVTEIEKYIKSPSDRPVNFLMIASPGAGKSHFIKCIAEKLSNQNVVATTFNMASMSTSDELIQPLDASRTAKIDQRFPLLFLDEFDSNDSNYGLLLPLLWDGEINLGQRTLKLGRSIIVLAGSNPKLNEIVNDAKSMGTDINLDEATNPKIIDLLSRINGSVIRIPPFWDKGENIDRRVDKVVIAVELLSRKFKGKLTYLPVALLRFVYKTTFRYGVRSITNLINLISIGEPSKSNIYNLDVNSLGLPLNSVDELRESSLAYHLIDQDKGNGHTIVNFWKEAITDTRQIPIKFIKTLSRKFNDEHGLGELPILELSLSEMYNEIKDFQSKKEE